MLSEAYPVTPEAWVDGFMRDAHPESEIQSIEACAVVYLRLSAQAQLSLEEKGQLYAVVCVASTGALSEELGSYIPAGKGLPPLEMIAQMYEEAARSGSRP